VVVPRRGDRRRALGLRLSSPGSDAPAPGALALAEVQGDPIGDLLQARARDAPAHDPVDDAPERAQRRLVAASSRTRVRDVSMRKRSEPWKSGRSREPLCQRKRTSSWGAPLEHVFMQPT